MAAMGHGPLLQGQSFGRPHRGVAPAGVDGQKVVASCGSKGIWIAGGQAQAKGKIIRIAHMGFIDDQDLLGTLGGLEIVLNGLGYKVEPGAGIKAAQEILGKEAGVMKVLISDNLHQAGIDILKPASQY